MPLSNWLYCERRTASPAPVQLRVVAELVVEVRRGIFVAQRVPEMPVHRPVRKLNIVFGSLGLPALPARRVLRFQSIAGRACLPAVQSIQPGGLAGGCPALNTINKVRPNVAVKTNILLQVKDCRALGLVSAGSRRQQTDCRRSLLSDDFQAPIRRADPPGVEHVLVRQETAAFCEKGPPVRQELLVVGEVDVGHVLLDGLKVRVKGPDPGDRGRQRVLDVKPCPRRVAGAAGDQCVREEDRPRRIERRCDAGECVQKLRLGRIVHPQRRAYRASSGG